MKEAIFKWAPVLVQNLLISLYNDRQWRKRRAGEYEQWRRCFQDCVEWSPQQISKVQKQRLKDFLAYSIEHSSWYNGSGTADSLESFPVLEKRDLVDNLSRIATVESRQGHESYTGGTTGASLKVFYTWADTQQRFAMLDWFRSLYGWELGSRTAWFSGKDLTREKDLTRGICFRDDWINKIRFFSTFHINERNFEVYWKALCDFRPEFIVGFPSSLLEICIIAQQKGLKYPGKVKVFFPTAEAVQQVHRDIIGDVLGCITRDQYASSEGAPFIIECPQGSLHMHPLSGIFEIVDETLMPANHGELLVTSFTTHGTPLIRYRIGDVIGLASKNRSCSCGWPFQIVEEIGGRTADFLWSPEYGKVNLGNLSNSTKDVKGIVCFQIEQSQPSKIILRLVTNDAFSEVQERKLIGAMQARTGKKMRIEVIHVTDIPREKSGKFRIIKNTLHAEQMKLGQAEAH